MALTVEELQIVLSCDATTAQTVLKQMSATVKAYTDKFQSYFDKLGIDKNPKTIVGDVKAVEKQLDNVTKAILGKGKEWKAAYEKTWGEAFDDSMRKARRNSRKTSGYVPTGNKFVGDPSAPWANRDTVLQNSAEVTRMTFGNMRAKQDIVGLGRDVFATLGGKLEEVGNLTAAVRMKIIDARNAVQKFGQAYVSAAENFGSDAKDTLKVEEKFKKAIVAADKYVQQLDKVIAKEQEQAQAAANAAAQRRAEQLALEAQARVEAALRQQRIAATTAAIQAEHEPSRVLAPSMGDVFSGFSESASGAFTSIRSRASEAFSFILGEVGELTSEMASDFSIAGGIIQGVFLGVKMIFKGIVAAIRGVINAVKRVGNAIKKAFNHSLLGRFLKRLGTVMMRMAAMALIRGTIDGVKKGLEELAKTSESSAKAMNSIKAASGSIKMALGAAVMPIVKALVPWFLRAAEAITALGNAIAQFFARVTGQSHYTAVAITGSLDDISSSAGGAGKAVKGALAAFDELVVISKSSGGGGGGSSGVDSSLSSVTDALAFSELGDRIREAILEGNWAGVGGAVAEKLNSAITDWNAAESAQKVSEKIENILDIAIGFFENFDSRKLAQKLKEWFENVDWEGISTRVFELLGSIFGSIGAFLAELLVPEGEFTFSGFLTGLGNAIKNIGTWIVDNIFTPFINGFKLAFGIASPAKEMEGPGEMVGEGILVGISNALNRVEEIFTAFKDIIEASLGIAGEYVGAFFETLIDFIAARGEIISGNVQRFILNIKASVLEGLAGLVDNLADGPMGRLLNLIGVDLAGAAETLRGKAADARDAIGEIDDKIADAQATAANGFDISANVNTSKVTDLKNKINDAKAAIRDTSSATGGLSEKLTNIPTSRSCNVTIKVNTKGGTSTSSGSVTVSKPSVNITLDHLAVGGIAYGPAAALIGEYAGAAHNPEVVAPLSDLVGILAKVGAPQGGSSEEEMRLLREQNTLLRQIAQKELKLSPSTQLGQVVERSRQLYART